MSSQAVDNVRLRYVARLRYGMGQPPPLSDGEGVPILRATNIQRGRITRQDLQRARLQDLPLDRAPLLEVGEILVVRSGAYTGDSAIVTDEWVGAAPGYDLRVTPGTAVDPRFLSWCLLSRYCLDQIELMRTRAAQPHINADELASLRIPLPERQVQRRIADYLDTETASIDLMLSKIDRVASLSRQRLDELATWKICGEAGIANKSWRSAPLWSLANNTLKYGAGESGQADAPEGWPRYIRITDIAGPHTLRGSGMKFTHPRVAADYPLRNYDILLARSGATVGKSFLYDDGLHGYATWAGYLIRLRLAQDRMLPAFFMWYARTRGYWSQVTGGAPISTIQNFSAERYSALRVPTPPMAEQVRIVKSLDDAANRTRTFLAALKRQERLLKERRQALITVAVTGEVEV